MPSLKTWIWLSELRGVTGQTRLALLRHFGSPEKAFYADPEELALAEGVSPSQAALLRDHDLSRAETVLAECERLGVRIVTIGDTEYPDRLRNIYDPPLLLYVRGRLPSIDETAVVSVVGTRECTPYGVACAEKLSYGLAKGGAVVVSGLAKGIDAAATRGALRGGGVTVGVVGNGLDVTYPSENRYLYEDVAVSGALISEYPPGTGPVGSHFPARNRIIAGLALATLVVEAPAHSGALITAHAALEQGRDVFAVPGPIDAPASVGCNRLIRDGAGSVMEAWDILQMYQGRFPLRESREEPEFLGRRERRPPAEEVSSLRTFSLSREGRGLTDDQIEILKLLTDQPQLVDSLIEQSGIPTRRVLSAVTLLELDGLAVQHSGKRYARAVVLTE